MGALSLSGACAVDAGPAHAGVVKVVHPHSSKPPRQPAAFALELPSNPLSRYWAIKIGPLFREISGAKAAQFVVGLELP